MRDKFILWIERWGMYAFSVYILALMTFIVIINKIYNENNLGGFQGPSNPVDGQDAENPVRVQSIGNQSNKTT